MFFLADHTGSTHDSPDSGNELQHTAYDPLDVLGDIGDEVDFTTPLDEEEISGT